MIGGGEIYRVLEGMVPLYLALGLGYASVKWLQMFQPDQCNSINKFNFLFIFPFFVLNFISGLDPYHFNIKFIGADVIGKAITAVAITVWARVGTQGSLAWSITTLSLSCFNNALVVGVPLLGAMYGPDGEILVVQSAALQCLVYICILLFLYEFHHAIKAQQTQPAIATGVDSNTPSSLPPQFRSILKRVAVKLLKNPSCIACVLGIIWTLISKRWNLKMPTLVEGCILIMGKAGSGVSMFTVGQFMALNNEILARWRLTIFCLALRFVVAPLTTLVGCLALGLRANILDIAIMQSALPHGVISFLFAQEYNLHSNTLSTAVILGTIISLPLLIAYYAILNVIH